MVDYKSPIVVDGHFTWGEYALLRQWGRYATPTAVHEQNAIFLFNHLEKLIRLPLNKPITISSGARTLEYTAYLRKEGIPAALRSAHITWEGVDILPPPGMTNAEFWHYCDERWPGRMEKLEFTPTWVHLDSRSWGSRLRFKP